MGELPSGTVSLLFSDIEGSTMLLSRLGPAYTDALDGQRLILRKAWVTHAGTEMGTEGDSFFVVFRTAEDAVNAAAQAQREMAAFTWPAGETVRVRMGIHTGTPRLHDGGYVGMDVHRAARIAGAAHGGQVLLSNVTAGLAAASLPAGVTIKGLGSHRLKDIAAPERLSQLVIDGLRVDFPPIKTLGAASSLPRPATPLVGRDGELVELTALLSSPDVRLVTLTGPGGTGKTRLATALADRLVPQFADGVFFVPLAAVTGPEVMWTTIGEVLDVPSEDRAPPGLFAHVAHRSALFVLDNLEQLSGAEGVVSELLQEAPQVAVVATSRRALNVAGERQHPVPPLELPEVGSGQAPDRSGAVQLFVQHAFAVKPGFALTPANVDDVVEVCRRLDGLPLAIELAAARSKLLSPAALRARLDKALELKDSGVDRPTRQRTLRATIDWSYDLLDPTHQAFFRHLGVFAGGADLNAVSAVTSGVLGAYDPLDLLADLVDASLTVVGEDLAGEPRIRLLETVRVYAHELLSSSNELDGARKLHALHYATLAEFLQPLLDGDRFAEARSRFEVELDNFRAALHWALQPSASAEQVLVGMRLCRALASNWNIGGYNAEGLRHLERAVELAHGTDSPELAECLNWLSRLVSLSGDIDRAYALAVESVDMWRRLGSTSKQSVASLEALALFEAYRGQTPAARSLYEEVVSLGRLTGDKAGLLAVLLNFAIVEHADDNYQRSLELNTEALALARDLGSHRIAVMTQHNMACTLRKMGQVELARQRMEALTPEVLQVDDRNLSMALAEDYAAVLVELGEHARAVRLLGAADTVRERLGVPRDPLQEQELAASIDATRATLTPGEWEDAYQSGRGSSLESALVTAQKS